MATDTGNGSGRFHGRRLPADGGGAARLSGQVVPVAGGAGTAARTDAAQRLARRRTQRRPPTAVGRDRRAGVAAVRGGAVAAVRAGADGARRGGLLLQGRGDPRARPRHGVPDQVAERAVHARVLPVRLRQRLRLQGESQLPPPLHAASRGRPRSGAAAEPHVSVRLPAAAIHGQHYRRLPVGRAVAGAAPARDHRRRPLSGRDRQGRRRRRRVDAGDLPRRAGDAAQCGVGGALHPALPGGRGRAADRAGRADPGPAADRAPGRRPLAALAGGRADACRPARQRARLPPVRAQQHPRPDLGVPVLEHELAHRASHVRRRAMLQPRQAVPGDPRRHARTAHAAGIMARDPGHLEAATAGTRLPSTTRPCPRPRTRRFGRRPTCRGVPRRRAAGTRRSTQPATRSPR